VLTEFGVDFFKFSRVKAGAGFLQKAGTESKFITWPVRL